MNERLGSTNAEWTMKSKPKIVLGKPELMVIDGEVYDPAHEEMIDPGVVSELTIREASAQIVNESEVLPYK